MPLIQLVIVLVVIGVILWLVNRYIPMQAPIRKIINAVVIIAVILWLLSVFGVIGNLSTIRIGR
jgi:flagellar biogenesis protein FliO